MVDLAIGAAISGLKAAGELAGGFVKLRDEAMIQSKVIELQTVILAAQSSALAAQSEQFTLLETKRELEARIAELEAWDAEKKRYGLTDLGGGRVAFALKPDAQGAEPDHQLCTACFGEGHKGYLQMETRYPGMSRYLVCQRCNSEIALDHVNPEHRGAKPRKPPAPPKGGYRPF